MLPERKKKPSADLAFFFFATSFISISFLKPHLASWSSNLPSRRTLQGRKKGEKTTGGMAKGQLDQDAYIIYSLPSLLLLEELCFFFFSFFLLLFSLFQFSMWRPGRKSSPPASPRQSSHWVLACNSLGTQSESPGCPRWTSPGPYPQETGRGFLNWGCPVPSRGRWGRNLN